VDDAEIHRVNQQYLGHDYPTDVISFPLHHSADEDETIFPNVEGHNNSPDFVTIEGELIVSTETARREATAHGWSPEAELLLYIVHGLLHLCGYDDIADEERPKMRNRERELLALWGLCPTGLEA
jgi:probable rRNA maturation factor